MTDRRMVPALDTRPRNIARAIAAGCAITCIGEAIPSGRHSAGSAKGARSRASGCSSSPPARSIRRGPPWGFTLRALRLEAGEPAKNATVVPARLSAESGAMTIGSSSSAASLAVPSPEAEISCTRGAGLLLLSTSRSSFASSESPPTSAISGRSVRLANLMLRAIFRRLRWTHPPPYDASGADHNPAENVAHRHSQQHGLGHVPDQVDQDTQHHEGQGRSRTHQVEVLETGVAPRADHQEGQQSE